MSDFPIQKVTIYHKNGKQWDRYVKEASYRNTSVVNHNKNGSNSTEKALIRIFDVEGYNLTWFALKDDVIVNKEVQDVIEGNTPITQLSNQYGKDNVHKVTSIDKFIFDDEDVKELNHVKLGCV
ncbi:MAG: hypothetical protein HFJ35_02745 [Clostridia bacterium]|nr:hypothetical protein [Clostridia bacterium]